MWDSIEWWLLLCITIIVVLVFVLLTQTIMIISAHLLNISCWIVFVDFSFVLQAVRHKTLRQFIAATIHLMMTAKSMFFMANKALIYNMIMSYCTDVMKYQHKSCKRIPAPFIVADLAYNPLIEGACVFDSELMLLTYVMHHHKQNKRHTNVI